MKKIMGLMAIIFVSFVGTQSAHAMITSQLDLGDSGSNVNQLQTYLSANPNLYPSGLVTGFYGSLTQGGVQKFQVQQNIVSSGSPETTGYGRVGPTTLISLNNLIGGNFSSNTAMSPILSTASVQIARTSATVSWFTNVPTQGNVFYDTVPLRSDEATGPRQEPYVSGVSIVDGAGQTTHSITIQNLQPNTTYYFLVRSTDGSGNMSMLWPSTFTTTN